MLFADGAAHTRRVAVVRVSGDGAVVGMHAGIMGEKTRGRSRRAWRRGDMRSA